MGLRFDLDVVRTALNVASIADLLHPSFFLLPFSLHGNALGETAGCAIGQALEKNTTLTSLM